jgi:hypothetical protein
VPSRASATRRRLIPPTPRRICERCPVRAAGHGYAWVPLEGISRVGPGIGAKQDDQGADALMCAPAEREAVERAALGPA